MINSQRGQTLLEVLVALGTAVVIVSSVTSVVISSLNNAEFERNQAHARAYAGQGLELVRSMRSNDYATFRTLTNSYCFAKSCIAISTTQGDPCGPKGLTCGQNVDTFVREIKVTQDAPECANIATEVTSMVSWADGKCTDKTNPFCHSAVLSSCLSNFGLVVIPPPAPTGPTATPIPTTAPTSTSTPAPEPTPTPIPSPTPLPLPLFNNEGISRDANPTVADFDGVGNSYSKDALSTVGFNSGGIIQVNGITFQLPVIADGKKDNWQANGQIVPLNPRGLTLGFLGAADHGPSSGTATITYTDSTTQTFTLTFGDWTLNNDTSSVPPGNTIVNTTPYRNTPSGPQARHVRIFYTSVQLNKTNIKSVTLPSNVDQGNIHVFAAGN